MNKKILIFLGGILFLIVATVGAILWLKSKNTTSGTDNILQPTPIPTIHPSITPTTSPSVTPTGDTTPTPIVSPTSVLLQGLTQISASAAVSPALSYDGKSMWYFTPTGHLYKENLSSGLTQEFLLPSNVHVDDVIWPHSGNDFIIVTKGTDGKQFTYYDSGNAKYIQYPPQVKEVDYMPDGIHIIYQWSDASGSTLSSAKFDLTSHIKILDLPDTDDVIKVSPLGTRVLLYKSDSASTGKLYYVPLDSPKLITIKTGVDNRAIWAPDGQKFLFVKLDPAGQNNTQLWLGDISTGNDQALGIIGTADKAGFDNAGQNAYMASPASDGSGDVLYQFDIANLVKTQLLASSPSSKIGATNLEVSLDGAELYFINTSDGFIYSLDLN